MLNCMCIHKYIYIYIYIYVSFAPQAKRDKALDLLAAIPEAIVPGRGVYIYIYIYIHIYIYIYIHIYIYIYIYIHTYICIEVCLSVAFAALRLCAEDSAGEGERDNPAAAIRLRHSCRFDGQRV